MFNRINVYVSWPKIIAPGINMDNDWTTLKYKSGQTMFMYNKVTREHKWPNDGLTKDNIIHGQPVIYQKFCTIGTQTEDNGCQNGCGSVYIKAYHGGSYAQQDIERNVVKENVTFLMPYAANAMQYHELPSNNRGISNRETNVVNSLNCVKIKREEDKCAPQTNTAQQLYAMSSFLDDLELPREDVNNHSYQIALEANNNDNCSTSLSSCIEKSDHVVRVISNSCSQHVVDQDAVNTRFADSIIFKNNNSFSNNYSSSVDKCNDLICHKNYYCNDVNNDTIVDTNYSKSTSMDKNSALELNTRSNHVTHVNSYNNSFSNNNYYSNSGICTNRYDENRTCSTVTHRIDNDYESDELGNAGSSTTTINISDNINSKNNYEGGKLSHELMESGNVFEIEVPKTERSSPRKNTQMPFNCNLCGKEFRFKRYLQSHQKRHVQEKAFGCSNCLKTFRTKTALTEHMRTHTGEKPFGCSHCDKKFALKVNLTRHIRLHTGEKPYVCSYCERKFTQKSQLNYHIKVHTGEKPHACSYCERKFARSEHLKCHLKTHTGEKPFTCLHCNKKFAHKENLVVHVRTHTGEKPLKCSLCEQRFAQRNSLLSHLSNKHGKQKPFECTYYDKKFVLKCQLSDHTRTHTGERPFKCELCEKAFTSKSTLGRHLLIHSGQKRFSCSYCEKKFADNGGLRIHLRTHTNEKPFECSYCGRKFAAKHRLKDHIRVHTGDKYKCPQCDKEFVYSYNFRKHVKAHGV